MSSKIGPAEEGRWPQSRHVREWEVGLRHIYIYEASEQWQEYGKELEERLPGLHDRVQSERRWDADILQG